MVFSATSGMGRECDRFYKRVCELLAEKRKVPIQQVTQWVRRKLSHSLMKSDGMCLMLCLRGDHEKLNNEEFLFLSS